MIKVQAFPLLLREINSHILNVSSPREAAISSSSSCSALFSHQYHIEESHQHLESIPSKGSVLLLHWLLSHHKPDFQSWLWNAEKASLSSPLSGEIQEFGFWGVWTKHGPSVNLSLLQILLFRYCLAGNVAAMGTTLPSWGHPLQDSYLPWGGAVHSTPSSSLQGAPRPLPERLKVEQHCPHHPEWSPGLLGASKMF